MNDYKRKRIGIFVSLILIFLTGTIVSGSTMVNKVYKNRIEKKQNQGRVPAYAEVDDFNDNERTITEGVSAKSNTSAVPVFVDETFPQEYRIDGFPIIWQMPELPTGCEITALTMALQYYGYDVDKIRMASDYLPTVGTGNYYGDDGKLYGNDLNKYFIGNPFTEDGIICGTGAIISAADVYLESQESTMRSVDRTGSSPEELYELVSQDIPVVVWVTIGMQDRYTAKGWYTENGDYVDWSTNDHGAVLIGYTEDSVIIADPISGETEYDRNQFEKVFESRSAQCITLE